MASPTAPGHACLVFDQGLLPAPGRAPAVDAMLHRFRQRGVRIVGFTGAAADAPLPPVDQVLAGGADRPGPILRTLASLQAPAPQAWLITADPARIAVAGTAGLLGVVLVGVTPPADTGGVWVRHAAVLEDVPLALVPPAGGCWHRP